MGYMKWNCLWGWVLFAVCLGHFPSRRPSSKAFPHLTLMCLAKGPSSMPSSVIEGHVTCEFIILIFLKPPMGGIFISTLPRQSSAWNGMIPSISHPLLLIQQGLANVTTKLLSEGMSTSQGTSVFPVILACILERLYDKYDVRYRFLMNAQEHITTSFPFTCTLFYTSLYLTDSASFCRWINTPVVLWYSHSLIFIFLL